MKILYHHRTQAEDAQGIHIDEMVRAFRNLGHEVEMVALVEGGKAPQQRIQEGLWEWIVHKAPRWVYELMGLIYNAYGYLHLSRSIQRQRPDLIYERYSLNTFCGILASRRFRIPLVLEVNAPLYYEQISLGRLTFKRLARFLERWICSNATYTLVVSNVMRAILIQEGVAEERLKVMPNGIDPKAFHPKISGKALRHQYGLEGKWVIGFIGWFRPWHGLEMLLEVMFEARLAEKGVRLLLVGDGPAYLDLYRYAENHGLLSDVIFTGSVKRQEIPAHIAAMDIAVQPSATEYACPMKIFEYMAMGKCIVAPDQPNIREILKDQVTGFLFKPENKEALKLTLLELLDHPVEKGVVGQQAHETIFERGFLWEANAQRTLDLVFGKGDRVSSKSVSIPEGDLA